MSDDIETRVRNAIEQEFGEQSDAEFINVMSKALLSYMKRQRAIYEEQVVPVTRKPTNIANVGVILDKYPKTVRTVIRELSIYKFHSKAGLDIPPQFMPGIAVAIIDHILEAGELA